MFKHIRTRLLTLMIPVVFVTLLLSYIASISTGKQLIDSQINDRIPAEQALQKSIIENNLKSARNISSNLAEIVENTYLNEDLSAYEQILNSVVQSNSFILGTGIWFEPYAYDKNVKYVGPYVYQSQNSIITTYAYSNHNYDYFNKEYYTLPKEKADVVFTDAYFDETSGFYMITCSHPMYAENGSYLGCITVDIEISSLQKLVTSYESLVDSTMFIVNKDGVYLASKDIQQVQNGASLTKTDNTSLKNAADEILTHEKGVTYFIENQEKYRLYYTTLDDLEWKFVFQIPESSINKPVTDLTVFLVLIGFFAILLIGGTIFFVTHRNIARPIDFLLKEIGHVGDSIFDTTIPVQLTNRRDEFGILGKSFEEMKVRLKQYQNDLENALDENVAANEELIQQNELLIENEDNLRTSNHYITKMVEAMPDILFVVSKDGVFLDCQGSTANLYLPSEKIIGASLWDLLPPSLAALTKEKIEIALETDTLQTFEYQMENHSVTDFFELRIVKYLEDRVIAISRSITEQYKHLKEIEYLSFFDQVTGLHNRRFFDNKLAEYELAPPYPLSIIISDVNGLKMINDSFGHDMGDLLLQKYSKVLKETVSQDELACRIGGDEFAVILPGKALQETEAYVQNLQQKCNLEQINGIILSVSFGFGTLTDSSQSIRDIIKLSEDQMYQNKLFEAPSRRGKTIDVIIRTLQEKNPREEQHSHRVADLCEAMARELGMSPTEISRIRSAGLMHDIGKIGIPEDLLNKPGSLTKEEYDTICKHPEIGYRILQTASHMADISDVILSHHERYDGKGYPRGLKGEDIPFTARMIAIADTFDAMTSERSYRSAMSEEKAAEEILNNAGTQFDPHLAYVFVKKILGL